MLQITDSEHQNLKISILKSQNPKFPKSQNLVTWQLDGQVSFLRLMFNEFWDWSILVVGLSSRPRLLWRLHYRVTLLVKCYLSPCFYWLTYVMVVLIDTSILHTCVMFMLIDTFILHTFVRCDMILKNILTQCSHCKPNSMSKQLLL